MASLCQICREIPFSRLPSETEAGYPHHPSREALTASADQCQLCRFILEAAKELDTAIADEKRKKTPQRFSMFMAPEKEGGYSIEMYFGPQLPADLGPVKGRRIAIDGEGERGGGGGKVGRLLGRGGKEKDRFKGDVVRPWIFGSWWAMEGPAALGQMNGNAPLKLIGIGVRMGKTPDIGDAEGNEGKHVRLRGTQFRIRTLDGK
jgi:hypothetical protein